jgi:hypothetical protein
LRPREATPERLKNVSKEYDLVHVLFEIRQQAHEALKRVRLPPEPIKTVSAPQVKIAKYCHQHEDLKNIQSLKKRSALRPTEYTIGQTGSKL